MLLPPLPQSMRMAAHCKEGHPVASRSRLHPPGDLTAIQLTPDQIDLLAKQSLDIFTLMANHGSTFAECLSSILLSGLHWGNALHREESEVESSDGSSEEQTSTGGTLRGGTLSDGQWGMPWSLGDQIP